MSKQSDAEQLKILRYVKSITPSMVAGILMTTAQREEYRKNFCPGCGSQMKISMLYFGENFCVECVEKFSQGWR